MEEQTWYVVTDDNGPAYVAKDEENARRWQWARGTQRAYDLNGRRVPYAIVPVRVCGPAIPVDG